MRINRLTIKQSGILQNLDVAFKPITLVIGDNERGKTNLLNWVARCIFEKPSKNSFGETWSDNLDSNADVVCNVQPLYRFYDGERLKNLLFISELDLQFKYKNTEHNALNEFWDQEVQALFYGQDDISETLKSTFLTSMGVGNSAKSAWLSKLHAQIFELKEKLEECIPDVEIIRSKYQGLEQINENMGALDQESEQIESKTEMFHLANKISLGKRYLEGVEKYEQINHQQQSRKDFEKTYEEQLEFIQNQEEELFEIEDNIVELKLEIAQSQHNNQEIPPSFTSNVINFFLGVACLFLGLYLAYLTRTSPINFWKILSAILFIIGLFFLVKTWVKTMAVQMAMQEDNAIGSLFKNYLDSKHQKITQRKQTELDNLQNKYQQMYQECQNLRRELKSKKYQNPSLAQERAQQDFITHLNELAIQVKKQFGTDDPNRIRVDIEMLEEKIEYTNQDLSYEQLQKIKMKKQDLSKQQSRFSSEYESKKNNVVSLIKPLISEIKEPAYAKDLIYYFYPEIERLDLRKDFDYYFDLLDTVQELADAISSDLYKAQKLENIYRQIETSRDVLLQKVLASPIFIGLVHTVFHGKYQSFSANTDLDHRIRIFAHSGDGDVYPLESLSSAACSQFWFILRLVIAKIVLKEEPGIIILDDPFKSFDTLRKQSFVQLLNAFAHQGWQIVCSITDDPTIYREFQDIFADSLCLVDLNKEIC